MSGEWYVDPVGRFDGRFFDGTEWTDQVSDGGVLRTDPDWPPQLGGASSATSTTVDTIDHSENGHVEVAAVGAADAESKGTVGTRRMTGVERREDTDRRHAEVPVAYDKRSGERRQIDAIIEPERF